MKRGFFKSAGSKILMGTVCLSMLAGTSCSSLQNTWNGMTQSGQGATAGGGIGAAVGTGVGALIGGGKGAWIGALVGGALGAGTGALVGNSMDKQKKALESQLAQMQAQEDKNSQDIQDIKVQMVKDRNDLDAIKVVMGNSVLFPTNSYSLSAEADAALTSLAFNLKQFPNTDITVVGFTDDTGTEAYNQTLSEKRAQSVVNYLESKGISANRLQAVGKGEADPVASNSTVQGRAENRRVEIYITADKAMIQQAQQQSQS